MYTADCRCYACLLTVCAEWDVD